MNYFSQYKWMWWTIILLVALNIASIAFFIFGRHTENKRREYGMRHFMENELKLTDNQKKLFESEKNIHFQLVLPIFDSMRIERVTVSKAIFSNTTDSTAVMLHVNKLSNLQAQLEWLTFKHFCRLKDILTPDQQVKFEKDLNDMFQNVGHRYHGGGKEKPRANHTTPDEPQPNGPPPSL